VCATVSVAFETPKVESPSLQKLGEDFRRAIEEAGRLATEQSQLNQAFAIVFKAPPSSQAPQNRANKRPHLIQQTFASVDASSIGLHQQRRQRQYKLLKLRLRSLKRQRLSASEPYHVFEDRKEYKWPAHDRTQSPHFPKIEVDR